MQNLEGSSDLFRKPLAALMLNLQGKRSLHRISRLVQQVLLRYNSNQLDRGCNRIDHLSLQHLGSNRLDKHLEFPFQQDSSNPEDTSHTYSGLLLFQVLSNFKQDIQLER